MASVTEPRPPKTTLDKQIDQSKKRLSDNLVREPKKSKADHDDHGHHDHDDLIHDDRNSTGHKLVCLLYTSPSPRDATLSRMPSSA